MQNQYLIVAENITYKNNKLSCINIIDQFLAVKLPAEFNFDMVIICGPGWEPGEYDVRINIKVDENEETEIGTTKVNIPSIGFVYNALAPNLRIQAAEDVKNLTFVVYRNDEMIIEKTYPVSSLLVANHQEA